MRNIFIYVSCCFLLSSCFSLNGCFACIGIGPFPPVSQKDVPGTYIYHYNGAKQTLILDKDGGAASYRVLDSGEESGLERGTWSLSMTDRTWISITNFCLRRYSVACTDILKDTENPEKQKKEYAQWECGKENPDCPTERMEIFWYNGKIYIYTDPDAGGPFEKVL